MSGKVLPTFAGLRRLQVLLKCSFLKQSSTSANLPVGGRLAEWLTDFESLTQTMENNARSGVRRVQAEMSFIFIFPSVVRIEKTCVVF